MFFLERMSTLDWYKGIRGGFVQQWEAWKYTMPNFKNSFMSAWQIIDILSAEWILEQ
jgi:hypothetical protein